MGCVDKTVVVSEALQLSSVEMAVTSVSRCVGVVEVAVLLLLPQLLLLLLLLFPSPSMFSTTVVATVVQHASSEWYSPV